ncbi:VIR-like CYIR protein [Plasmodium cynomolgi strain B]|uniref:VIR-like CYIR protein n=1 Tax=Plasmodium cynomolgi (strain B) TaxID=1120755 RepID=K6UKS7_PLACD|nr:VIR-like CYIR protein [Plasmodium cynomolgi strain B]GAB67078.1 VIR-like CYIR protein [Plasmodium cynomolgi strain B]
MEPSTKNSWDEALLHLPAYQKYEQFDSVEISKETISECNALKSNDAGDKTLCKKVAQNLKKLSTLPDDELKSGCYYFQHWFFDNIAKKYYNGNKQGNNYNVAKELFDIVLIFTSKLPKIKPCYCHESGSPDVWKEEKDLHDYFENHKDIKCNDSDKSKCEKYVNYGNCTLYFMTYEYCVIICNMFLF